MQKRWVPQTCIWDPHDRHLTCCYYLIDKSTCGTSELYHRVAVNSCFLFQVQMLLEPGANLTSLQTSKGQDASDATSICFHLCFLYIYIFTNPCNYLYCSRSGTNEMCLLHGSGTWTCPGRESGSYTFGFALQLAYWDRISFKVRNASPQWFVENDFLFWVLFCKANAPPLLR